jgi:hypothetical protein
MEVHAVWRAVLMLSCAMLAASCERKVTGQVAATGQTCCQCPGILNEPPADPKTYRVAPDCQDMTLGQGECEALCKSLGRPGGRLQDGACTPAPVGAGGTCK